MNSSQMNLNGRNYCFRMKNARMPGAEGTMHAEYVRMQECVVQREQCMLNMLECKNAWCRGSNAC
jgi:hypothetical protein